MPYLLDTNILIHYIRDSKIWQYTEQYYLTKGLTNQAFISEVSEGEALSFAYGNRWSKHKIRALKILIDTLQPVAITPSIIKKFYANIDTYSQNRHKSLTLPQRFSARNMGKNDLWIAATAAALRLPLISTDKDFLHLDGVFIDFVYLDVEEIRQK